MDRSVTLSLALVVVLVACVAPTQAGDGGSTSTEPSTEGSPATAATDPASLLASGTWLDADGTPLRFDDDGTYAVRSGSYETGSWSVAGDVLTLATDDGSRFCEGTVGEYRLTFDGADGEATVETVQDPCDVRREVLGGGGVLLREPTG